MHPIAIIFIDIDGPMLFPILLFFSVSFDTQADYKSVLSPRYMVCTISQQLGKMISDRVREQSFAHTKKNIFICMSYGVYYNIANRMLTKQLRAHKIQCSALQKRHNKHTHHSIFCDICFCFMPFFSRHHTSNKLYSLTLWIFYQFRCYVA